MLSALVALCIAQSSVAAEQPSSDGGAQLAPDDAAAPASTGRFRDSLFVWDHSARTETVGLGRAVQSRNPTYEMTFRLAPRYYIIDAPRRNLSLRADVRLLREFTDSDTTTRRGEWTFTDSELWLLLMETLNDAPGAKTELSLRLPSLTIPTSNASLSSGRRLGLGAGVGLDQEVPLGGSDAKVLPRTLLRPRVGYTYQFVEAVVPTNDAIDRVRLYPSGQTLPSDQLSGTAFPQHQFNLSLRADTTLVENLTLTTELGFRYARRYALSDRVEVCAVITGCVAVESTPGSTRYSVSTLFAVDLAYAVSPTLILGLGYANLAGQLGADGQRRSVLYSPDARVSLSLTVILDQLYGVVVNRGAASEVAAVPRPSVSTF